MSKQQKIWWFVYFPADDHLMSLGDPTTKTFLEATKHNLSDHGLELLRTKDWKSFCIDTEVTTYWRKAYAIAAQYFGTRNPNDIDIAVSYAQESLQEIVDERKKAKFEHSDFLKTSARTIKRQQRYLDRLIAEKEKHL